MPKSLTVRFFIRFIGDFGRTVKDDKMSYAAIPATLVWFWINLKDLKYDIWLILGPLIFGASFVVCQHALSAARAVIREIQQSSLITEDVLNILDSSGRKSVVQHWNPVPVFYKLRLYGIFVTIFVLCLLACSWAVIESRSMSRRGFLVSPQLIENGTAAYGTGRWNINSNRVTAYPVAIEMFLQLQNKTNTAVMIDSLEYDIKVEADDWEPLPQMWDGTFYMGVYPKMAQISAPILRENLHDHNLQPGDTVSGWVFLDYPKSAAITMPDWADYAAHALHRDYVAHAGDVFKVSNDYVVWTKVFPYLPEFRAKIATTAGEHFIVTFSAPNDPAGYWGVQGLSFTLTEGYEDISNIPYKFYRSESWVP